MLRFEYVQYGEFHDPEYKIRDDEDNEYIGYLYYNETWLFTSDGTWGLSWEYLNEISDKLKELKASTQSQQILGVF